MGRIICELERIYGVRQGSNNPKGTNIGDLNNTSDVTQEQIAQKNQECQQTIKKGSFIEQAQLPYNNKHTFIH